MFGIKNKKIEKLIKINDNLNNENINLKEKNESLTAKDLEHTNKITLLESQLFEAESEKLKLCGVLNDLKDKMKSIYGRNVWLVKYNNHLLKEINRLKQEIETKSSLIKVLPPDRTKGIQKTRLKNRVRTYQAKEILKSKTNNDNLN